MVISSAQRDALVAHAREAAPDECCGWMRGRGGSVEEVFRASDARTWRFGFEFGFRDLVAMNEADDEGYEVAVYHSHPRSSAEPSQQDINVAQYPGWTYVIVSLAAEEPEVRAWRIAEGRVEEEAVELGG